MHGISVELEWDSDCMCQDWSCNGTNTWTWPELSLQTFHFPSLQDASSTAIKNSYNVVVVFFFFFFITFCTLFSPWNAVYNQANNCWYRRQKKEENDWLMPQKRRSHFDSQRFPNSQQQEQQQQRSQRYCAGSSRWFSFTWEEGRETPKEIRKPVYPPPQGFFFLLLNKIWRYFFSRNCGKKEFPSVLSARLRTELWVNEVWRRVEKWQQTN